MDNVYGTVSSLGIRFALCNCIFRDLWPIHGQFNGVTDQIDELYHQVKTVNGPFKV